MASDEAATSCWAALDPWTATTIAAHARRQQQQQQPEEPRAGMPGALAEAAARARQAGTATQSPASKFALPAAGLMKALRSGWLQSGARTLHDAAGNSDEDASPPGAAAAHVGGAQQPGQPMAACDSDGGSVREAKRRRMAPEEADPSPPRTSGSGAAAALKRLCTALGVHTQHAHLPAQRLTYAVASTRGWRVAMEDAYAAEVPLLLAGGSGGRKSPSALSLFAVYDGHGGAEVARYAATRMGREVTAALVPQSTPPVAAAAGAPAGPATSAATPTPAQAAAPAPSTHAVAAPAPPQPDAAAAAAAALPSPAQRAAALRSAFLSLDARLAEEGRAGELAALANLGDAGAAACATVYGRRGCPEGPYLGPSAGSTATVVLLAEDGVTVAGVGDSRCILGVHGGSVAALSVDHKGLAPAEMARVLRAGLWVSPSGRVAGELDMSRALGDADLKRAPHLPPHRQAVTAQPTTRHARLQRVHAGGHGGAAAGSAPRAARGSDGGAEAGGGSAGGAAAAAAAAAGAGASAGASMDGSTTTTASRGSGGGARGPMCYILLATDGLWNVMDTEQVHAFVDARLEGGGAGAAEAICAQLAVEACVSERTVFDNVTVMLLVLEGHTAAIEEAETDVGVEGEAAGAGEADAEDLAPWWAAAAAAAAAAARRPRATATPTALVGQAAAPMAAAVAPAPAPPPPAAAPAPAGPGSERGARGGCTGSRGDSDRFCQPSATPTHAPAAGAARSPAGWARPERPSRLVPHADGRSCEAAGANSVHGVAAHALRAECCGSAAGGACSAPGRGTVAAPFAGLLEASPPHYAAAAAGQ